jgi:hypothetical protein
MVGEFSVKFKDEWNQLKQAGHYGSFSFKGTANDWRSAVASHFKTSTLKRPCYGVYVVSQSRTGKVIYVGKSGTMCQDGSFKDQDLEKRLVNREKKQSRKEVFGQRVLRFGELLIEYVVVKSQSLIPGYLEARLLQAYYDEHKELPIDNASL